MPWWGYVLAFIVGASLAVNIALLRWAFKVADSFRF